MKFIDQMKDAEQKLISMGHEVKRPEIEVSESWIADWVRLDNVIWNESKFSNEIKREAVIHKWRAIQNHYKKIKWSEAILVINEPKKWIDWYIWWNTLMEIGVAFYDNKKIFILHSIWNMSYTSEILWCDPVILSDNLFWITS